MGSGRNQSNFIDDTQRNDRLYKKPTLKRHGLVSELTQTTDTGSGLDNYSGPSSYSYS